MSNQPLKLLVGAAAGAVLLAVVVGGAVFGSSFWSDLQLKWAKEKCMKPFYGEGSGVGGYVVRTTVSAGQRLYGSEAREQCMADEGYTRSPY